MQIYTQTGHTQAGTPNVHREETHNGESTKKMHTRDRQPSCTHRDMMQAPGRANTAVSWGARLTLRPQEQKSLPRRFRWPRAATPSPFKMTNAKRTRKHKQAHNRYTYWSKLQNTHGKKITRSSSNGSQYKNNATITDTALLLP